MNGTVAEIYLRLTVVIAERGAWLGAAVVTGVAVGYRITFGDPMVREIKITILAAIAPLQEATVEVLGKRQLCVKVYRRRDDAAHVAIGGVGLIIVSYARLSDGKIT